VFLPLMLSLICFSINSMRFNWKLCSGSLMTLKPYSQTVLSVIMCDWYCGLCCFIGSWNSAFKRSSFNVMLLCWRLSVKYNFFGLNGRKCCPFQKEPALGSSEWLAHKNNYWISHLPFQCDNCLVIWIRTTEIHFLHSCPFWCELQLTIHL
jgi:hypothetical protein